MKEKTIVSPFEIYDNLRDAYTGLHIQEHYDHMVDTILLPYTVEKNIGLSEETANIIFGRLMAGKSLAARQCALKLATDRHIKEVLESRGKSLTSILLRFDPFLLLSKRLLGVRWEEKASAGAYALASLGMENAVYWAHDYVPRPYVITIDAAVFPYDSLPYPHPGRSRDVGGSAVEAIAHEKFLNVFGIAILPNKERERTITAERVILTDASLTEKAKIKTDETARRKEVELRESMAPQEAIEAVQQLIFARFDQLISLRILPTYLADFRTNPDHEHEAYLRYYTMECRSLFGPDGKFKVVENPTLEDGIELHTYEEEVSKVLIIPGERILEATFRMINKESEIKTRDNLL